MLSSHKLNYARLTDACEILEGRADSHCRISQLRLFLFLPFSLYPRYILLLFSLTLPYTRCINISRRSRRRQVAQKRECEGFLAKRIESLLVFRASHRAGSALTLGLDCIGSIRRREKRSLANETNCFFIEPTCNLRIHAKQLLLFDYSHLTTSFTLRSAYTTAGQCPNPYRREHFKVEWREQIHLIVVGHESHFQLRHS